MGCCVKKISIFFIMLFLSGCSKTIDVYSALDEIIENAQNKPVLYDLKWYDTGDTCATKLQLANSQIIRMDNKLYIIEQQLEKLQEAVE